MKQKSKRSLALLLAAALLAGVLPGGSGTEIRAAEQPALRNPRILKTTWEVPPGTGGQKELKNPATEDGVTTWDCIWFGNYWQEDTNGDGKADKNDEKTPIKWRVLSVDGDDAFLVADKNLDVQRYNDTYTDVTWVTWETCTVRSWLNGYGAEKNAEGKDYSESNFLKNAFSADEQSAIKTINVVNDDNAEYETEGGNDTEDKVYLLSLGEVTNPAYGFTSSTNYSNTRQSVNTAYTAAGGETGNKYMSSAGGTDPWWLRSPGSNGKNASDVKNGGNVNAYVDIVDRDYVAVRPALHLNLKASPDALSPSSWSYAGTVPSDDVAEWDCVWFGNYWQEDTNGDGKADEGDEKTPVKWRVLSVDGDDAFLVADKNIDCQKYNDTSANVTWETCTVRSWLNGYGAEKNAEGKDYSDSSFLASAFSPGEQSAIRAADVVNADNPQYGTEGGNDTEDKVYLLSSGEATNPEYGFHAVPGCNAEGRRALNTAFAKEQGASTSTTSTSEEYAGNGDWWLRSPGCGSKYASFVGSTGYVGDGCVVSYIHVAVRPALHLNLSSSSGWSYAGTMTSDGKVSEVSPPAPGETPGASSGPDVKPTEKPGIKPTADPEGTEKPGEEPTGKPSVKPTGIPVPVVTLVPTDVPSTSPSGLPSQKGLRNPRILKTTQEVAPGTGGQKELKNPATEDGVTTWDCIWFGNYWQEDTNGDGKADKDDEKTPIKWRVLSVDGDDAFLVADQNLDVQRYNDTSTDVTWETCSIRSWLNGYGAEKNTEGKDYSGDSFFKNAFSADEQSAIRTANVMNDNNPQYETEGGNDTADKVYLLSLYEVTNPRYGFTSSADDSNTRQSVNTAYTAAGGEIGYKYMSSAGRTDYWWLRSPGSNSLSASLVNSGGYVFAYGFNVIDDYVAARPALHLNLKASPDALSPSSWSYAGTVPSDDVAEWDSIWFGNYWQEDTNGDGKADKNDEKTPIKWCVLSVDGDDAFLVADKNLDVQRYNDTYTDVTWETCTMRSWLNGYGAEKNAEGTDYSDSSFLASAFSPVEQSAIRAADVVNADNPQYGTEGGNDTEDKVYLLSSGEATNPEYGFGSLPDWCAKGRRALNTAFAKEQGASTSTSEEYAGNGYWWLRSPGYRSRDASYVLLTGDVRAGGGYVDSDNVAVRPALHLNLKASPDALSPSSWSYAGTVTSDGKVSEVSPPAPGESAEPTGTPVPSETPGASSGPDVKPTEKPGIKPTADPEGTEKPGEEPTGKPSAKPTGIPVPVVTLVPTDVPSTSPSSLPSQKGLRNPRILKTTREVPPGIGGQKELKNPATEDGVGTWDCVWFGNYWQEDTNGDGKADKNDEKTPIKWRVLSVDGDDAFLVADKNLDVQRYNDTSRDVTWETCTMRSWLNGYGADENTEGKDYSESNFLKNAFSADEQSAVKTTNVVNDDNSEYETEGGNDTEDKVYLLSISEVTNPAYGFTPSADSSNTRQSVNTAYTAAGGETGNKYMSSAGGTDSWWLRSPGDDSKDASYVYYSGSVIAYGSGVDDDDGAVRPALHLNLSSSSSWSYAGTVPSDDVAEWDCVWFGNYWQEDTNGDGKADKNDEKTPVKWRVLSVDGDDAFLVADKNLDCQKYNDTDTDVTWETCTVRSWLNGYGAERNAEGKDYSDSSFLAGAFSPGEQSAIRAADVVNEDNPWYGTEGGSDTEDRVYLLSLSEATNPEYGFGSFSDCLAKGRRALNTAFAKEQGAWTITSEEYAGNGYWWLRSPGDCSESASYVFYFGGVYAYGTNVDDYDVAVRPALHLNLSSSSGWSYAGTVTSDGKVSEEEPPVPGETPGASFRPDVKPTEKPAASPEVTPEVTGEPGEEPTGKPSAKPTEKPGIKPTADPEESTEPGEEPTEKPSAKPTEKPGIKPTADPEESTKPGEEPTMAPLPAVTPTATPAVTPAPGAVPTAVPGGETTSKPDGTPGAVVPSPQVVPSPAITPVPEPSVSPDVLSAGKVSSVKLKQKKQAATVSWKKTAGAAGYQICYSTSKSWKNKKQKLTRKTKLTIKKLKKNKTYYFRVRAYRMNGTKKVYGAWSKVGKIKIKK